MGDRLKQAVGNVVSGEAFWDREKDMELLIERIDEGANILLVAQRRIGKTSVLAELHERLGDRYICLFVDLQAARSGPEAIADLSTVIHRHRSLWEKTREVFANILETVTDRIEKVDAGEIGVTLRAGLTGGNWRGKGDQIFKILANCEKPVVLMFDELPIMVNYMLKDENFKITPERRKQTDEFLSWLRKNTIEHQGKVRTIVSGSIGLEPILRQARLSATVNHLEPFELKAWDEDTAKGCIRELAKGYDMTLEEGVPEEMVKMLVCCIPHHVQMFFSHIYGACKRRGDMSCSVEQVAEVFEKEMLGVRGHAELTHYEERLEMVLGKEMFTMALDMLTETAVEGCLTQEAIKGFQKEYASNALDAAEALKGILWVLEHDGYLEKSAAGHKFVSGLLQRWWKTRHGGNFVSVLQRGK